ncbi:MAG: TlpA family protein disulfide reductase, partial [Bryobacteraceae bacterium]
DPRNGTLGIDLNHDGRIERHSYECDYAKDETVVFRMDHLYLSTEYTNLNTGEILLRSHPPSDYQRIEMRAGTEVPDFSFTTLEGKRRKLSDFPARYLLLDFWGTWCAPCVAEIPHLKGAYARYHARGLEMIGMDSDERVAPVRNFLEARGAIWPQAQAATIRSLIRDRFRIQTWPFWIILDAQRRIVSLGADGQSLSSALERLFR